jgi:uncharacterized membrane protein
MEGSVGRLIIAMLVLAGCKGKEASIIECPEDSFLTYENFGQPFMLTWCTPCHSSYLFTEEERQEAKEGVNLDSYEDLLTHSETIQIFAVDTDKMPPAGGPSDDERDLLAEWIACGMPE